MGLGDQHGGLITLEHQRMRPLGFDLGTWGWDMGGGLGDQHGGLH